MAFDVIGMGTVVVDHLVTLPGGLRVDDKHEMEGHHMQVGGPVPTALVLLRRWGLKTSFIGGWSDDAHGQFIDADLAREDVDTRYALRDPDTHSGFAHVWIDKANATRTIAFRRSAPSWHKWDPGTVSWEGVRWVHLDGRPSDIAPAFARAAKEQGCRISLDTGSVKPSLDELIPLVDVMNCSRRFVRAYIGTDDPAEGARALLAMGPQWVTVTDGVNGAWMATPDGVIHQPAFAVDAFDTTGAGDTFAGALIYGVLQTWPTDRILRFACAAAAIKCRGLGNRGALPGVDEAIALAQNPA